MDPATISLIFSFIAEGVGVAQQIQELVIRARAGEVITDEEIERARAQILESCRAWDRAAEFDRPD